MEVEKRNEGGGERRGGGWSVLVSANGPGSGVWSKQSSQRISTIKWIERKKEQGREGKQRKKRNTEIRDAGTDGVREGECSYFIMN